MTTVLVRHTVEDFDDWQTVFEGHESVRRLHGATGHRVLRDGNNVTILTDFGNRDGADAFASDPSLKETMSKAGVIGAPDISFLDDVESVSY